jgi:hypothetical protein
MISNRSAQAPVSAETAWLGVVGQDVGRTTKPGYLGVYTQVERACECTAWLLGVEPSEKWPEYARTAKGTPRWLPGRKLTILDKDPATGKPSFEYTPQSRGEYMVLAYTPHMRILDVNVEIAKRLVPVSRL